MMYRVRFTREAEQDLLRLYDFVLERDPDDPGLAAQALVAIRDGVEILERSPYTCRKATPHSPYLRELLIPFGRMGYVALFEIDGPDSVTILAVRHQREDDYH
ncbi:type II toxin-antitoxin system RelE/ParE family toxin [Pigmentiphaga sp. H8]|uniref:type II toxin-antitoxin system RelE/ParE family toxin n=1 Tax=unclassified Pigmentiphaga TaxID=2626614 RepID=UPI000F5A8B50|nr:type II toxin-antitoxin system RelE/ParE family toxin [Pigmentiphaga sp. H8]AZG07209.1 type II toxin-antitoxin system RelE/ParE family toxin [Pigmentiphaga sp. H8]